MNINNEITVRTVRVTDIKKLTQFFVKAYGSLTVFQDERFLLYYFTSFKKKSKPFSYSLIAINSDGEIVSHYGGLFYQLKLNQKIIDVIWGVNAYTLPEWRGKQINSGIVNFLHNNYPANAVIGMPITAPYFYKKLGYNTFDKKTFKRFIYAFDSRVFDISCQLGFNFEKVKTLLKPINTQSKPYPNEYIVELTKENFKNFKLDLNNDLVITTNRSIDFLNWRLFNNPFIKYRVYGFLEMDTVISYIAIREETLEPNKVKVTRIIDLFGNSSGICSLLTYTIQKYSKTESVYIDFSMFGKLYEKELISFGFSKLENNDVCILPMVSAPIENRPNHEFIVLQSKTYDIEIQDLSSDNVYFTRIDADRDRIARITQLT